MTSQHPIGSTPTHYLVDEHYPPQPDLRALAAAADKHGQHIYTHWRDSNAAKANEAWCRAASPELVIGLLDRIAELEAQQGVPQGWKLVPVSPPDEMARAFRADDAPAYFLMTTIRCADFSERYAAMLAAAPTPPAQESQPLTDGEIIAAQEALIEAKDSLYRSRIGLQCGHCKKGTYRADGNGYNEFHRCNQCRHVPMWNADGTEFGIQEKPDGPTV